MKEIEQGNVIYEALLWSECSCVSSSMCVLLPPNNPPSNSRVKILIPKVILLGGGTFGT